MDKMIQSSNGDVTITNDGATILKQMSVLHPVARMVGDPLPTILCVVISCILEACGVVQGTGYRGWRWYHHCSGVGREFTECKSEITSKG